MVMGLSQYIHTRTTYQTIQQEEFSTVKPEMMLQQELNEMIDMGSHEPNTRGSTSREREGLQQA